MPRPLYLALTRRDYTSSTAKYSVTTLLKPPRVLALERRYDDQILIDSRRNAKALLGTAWHDYLERKARQYPEACEVVEEIMLEDVEVTVQGRTYTVQIKGQPDLHNTEEEREEGDLFALEEGTLWDYKTCSQWVAHPKYGPKAEWAAQLNIYGWMMRKRGYLVTALKISPMYTDWKKRDKITTSPLGDPIELELWDDDRTIAYIKERIVLHESVALLSDSELPLCTADNRWMRVGWKVRKRCDPKFKILNFAEDEQAARDEADRLNNEAGEQGLYVAFYVGDEPRRCNDWCNGALFCTQYRTEFPAEYQAQLATRLAVDSTPLVFSV